MAKQRYAIVDLETTGGSAEYNRITEIGIVLHDGEQIIDRFESLVNPETRIPYQITMITGIDDEMVADAPKFYEVAKRVVEITQGAIFVAHNVNFDFNFLRCEFKRLGYNFQRRRLCTVRMSRKAIPGLKSYSLKNLIKHFRIPVERRHRAMDDVLATVHVFEHILAQPDSADMMYTMLNLGVKEALLPPNLCINKLHDLPDACGIYYFHDYQGQVVYVGKSINIKKRVMQHFAKKTRKSETLQALVYDVSYELTGSEMIALLMESQEVKRLQPVVNRQLRARRTPWVIYRKHDERGYLGFGIVKVTARTRKHYDVVSEHPSQPEAQGKLRFSAHRFELCNTLCDIEKSSGRPCFQFHVKKCQGACTGLESVESYNERAEAASAWFDKSFTDDFLLVDNGRTEAERSVVLVQNGMYRGYGFVDAEQGHTPDLSHVEDCLHCNDGDRDAAYIIRQFLKKGKVMRIPLPSDAVQPGDFLG